MQKSFEIRFPQESDYNNLKALWQTSFDDSAESLEWFFKNTVDSERVLAVFEKDHPVSALYMLEADVTNKGKSYSAYYIYAVCTHPQYRGKGLMKSLFDELFNVAKGRGIDYLFLVPEKGYLFEIYKSLGFEVGFTYSQKIVSKKDFKVVATPQAQALTYEAYRSAIMNYSKGLPVAVLKQSTFTSFFNSVSGQVKAVFINGQGYALYEDTPEALTVFELFGNTELVLSAVFNLAKRDEIVLRQFADNNSIPYGMYYKINQVPEIHNGFFGIPYSN